VRRSRRRRSCRAAAGHEPAVTVDDGDRQRHQIGMRGDDESAVRRRLAGGYRGRGEGSRQQENRTADGRRSRDAVCDRRLRRHLHRPVHGASADEFAFELFSDFIPLVPTDFGAASTSPVAVTRTIDAFRMAAASASESVVDSTD
jgi:hypothetical protein